MLTHGEDVEVCALPQRVGQSRPSPATWAKMVRLFAPTSTIKGDHVDARELRSPAIAGAVFRTSPSRRSRSVQIRGVDGYAVSEPQRELLGTLFQDSVARDQGDGNYKNSGDSRR
jgi:hypothetical protein